MEIGEEHQSQDTMALVVYENGLDLEGSELYDCKYPIAFNKKRHTELLEGSKLVTQTWRMKERMKTVSVALVLCLNVGVDPPDIVKTQPCARLECWIDPLSSGPQKALEAIGNNLQRQYERWQPRARYKQSLDPTVDEVKKLCTSLRRNAKEERVLFHYNGHGVPKPTSNGEIWVFNKSYTQYIPLSMYDLQTWMGAPSIYVYDCSSAGTIVEAFKQFASQHEQEYEQLNNQNKNQFPATVGPPVSFKNCIQLGACAASQILPMNPELPADMFTSCLTTPIKMALRWFVMQKASNLVPGITLESIDKIPGQLNDRRTMLGELNWIFTAITDTIAWNILPRELFQKLFRQDLLVASLFRNFLLAERIMRSFNCSPVSSPALPPTFQHSMWHAWDLALDLCLAQLPGILERQEAFTHSRFFSEQLTAFQVWLTFGSDTRSPPEQLPIVLQVLLSQVHRLRALELLGKFLDLGPWAVNLALSVGIFPYVLKLLQSSARELRPLLVFIWAKILAVDSTCQGDLVRDNGHRYFLTVLEDVHMPAEHRTMSAFVLACIVHNYHNGQEAARQGNLISVCLEQLVDPNPLLRQWLAICLGRVWTNFEVARWCGVRDSAHEKLYSLLNDVVPEVRAAAVYALGTFMSSVMERSDHANTIDHSIAMTLVNTVGYDGSPLVRQELVVALHWLVLIFENQFVAVAYQTMDEERHQRDSTHSPDSGTLSPSGTMRRISSKDKLKMLGSPVTSTSPILSTSSGSQESSGSGDGLNILDKMRRVSSNSSITSLGGSYLTVPYGSIYSKIWPKFLSLASDPHPGVSTMAQTIVKFIKDKVAQALVQGPKELTTSIKTTTPCSPSSKTSFISGESPPANVSVAIPQEIPRQTNSLPRQQQPLHSVTYFSRTRRMFDKAPTSISEDSDDQTNQRHPLISTEFVDWSCKYFAQSVMKFPEETDPESSTCQQKEWRFMHNAKIRKECMDDQKKAVVGRLVDQVFINRSPNFPGVIKFHPYESIIAVAGQDYFSVWDWEQGAKLSHFPNYNNFDTTRITSLEFINPHDDSLLLLGSDDGAVRIWRNFRGDNGKDAELVTAWQALNEMLPSTRGAGLVTEWDQESCLLYTSGDVRIIRIWDAESELKFQDIPTGADSCVTSLSCDTIGRPLLVAGCGDGSIRLYDRRLPANESRVMTFREHAGWVVNVHVRKKADAAGKIVSGSVVGDVRFWDIRANSSIMTCRAAQGMTAMAVHSLADVFACGSVNQFISVYSCTGDNLSVIKYHDGFMGQRIGPTTCLSFHPFKGGRLPNYDLWNLSSHGSLCHLGYSERSGCRERKSPRALWGYNGPGPHWTDDDENSPQADFYLPVDLAAGCSDSLISVYALDKKR